MRPRRLHFPFVLLGTLLLLSLTGVSSAQEETRLLRFPHINGNSVVFTYAGDLYTASLSGGGAKRLTSHEGLEVFARFSPDGRWGPELTEPGGGGLSFPPSLPPLTTIHANMGRPAP